MRKLKFDDAPNYEKIKYFLLKDIEQMGKCLNGEFEWSEANATLFQSLSMNISKKMTTQILYKSLYE